MGVSSQTGEFQMALTQQEITNIKNDLASAGIEELNYTLETYPEVMKLIEAEIAKRDPNKPEQLDLFQ